MMIARMSPDDPSRAPAVISSLLSSTKPIATAERPAYELRIAITVGMSAPPIGMIRSTPNSSARTMMTGNRYGAHDAAGFIATSPARPSADAYSNHVPQFGHT